ncbi:hypothetical protein Y1Q_0011639 [Alligator mississippiensis]|uniref:Uncharacterized protein n=1 Tax=Alligator mississippiensis TaxID=8496 RepID=A0A151M0J7_ALLMI|nr:hypothetical protein Y1Q_0011639 [Alligator mississippiensis]
MLQQRFKDQISIRSGDSKADSREHIGVKGSAAAHGGEATLGSRDACSGSPPPTARALQMYQFYQRWTHQRWTQDLTILLKHLMVASGDWLEDSWAWQMEDVAHKDVWDQVD